MKSNMELLHLDVLFQIFEVGEHCLKYSLPPFLHFFLSWSNSFPLIAHTRLCSWLSFSGNLMTIQYSLMIFHSMLVLCSLSCWESVSYSCFLTFSSFFKFQTLFPSPYSQMITLLFHWGKIAIRRDFLSFLPITITAPMYFAFLPFQITCTCSILKLSPSLMHWIPFSFV